MDLNPQNQSTGISSAVRSRQNVNPLCEPLCHCCATAAGHLEVCARQASFARRRALDSCACRLFRQMLNTLREHARLAQDILQRSGCVLWIPGENMRVTANEFAWCSWSTVQGNLANGRVLRIPAPVQKFVSRWRPHHFLRKFFDVNSTQHRGESVRRLRPRGDREAARGGLGQWDGSTTDPAVGLEGTRNADM